MDTPQGWTPTDNALIKEFTFKDFAEAMIFVNAVAKVAEEENHHPDINIVWNKVTLTLSTHSAGGLTDLDFSMADKLNTLLNLTPCNGFQLFPDRLSGSAQGPTRQD